MAEHRVQIVSAKRFDERGQRTGLGRWFAEHNGVRLGEFGAPEAGAARRLLDDGLAMPSDTLLTYRGDMQCLTGDVGKLADAYQKAPQGWKDGQVGSGWGEVARTASDGLCVEAEPAAPNKRPFGLKDRAARNAYQRKLMAARRALAKAEARP
jgi:hypothetical protein